MEDAEDQVLGVAHDLGRRPRERYVQVLHRGPSPRPDTPSPRSEGVAELTSRRLRCTVGSAMRTSSRSIVSAVSDPFERFPSECELRISVEGISPAPLDVLAS